MAGAELQARVEALTAEEAAGAEALAGAEAAAAAERERVARAVAGLQAAERRLASEKERVARNREELAEAKRQLALLRAAKRDPAWRDWVGGLPDEVMEKVAGKVVAQTEAGWAAWLRSRAQEMGYSEGYIQRKMEQRKREGPSLFVFARVCKGWRKAQLKVGGPLRTRVQSDVILPGSVALAKWALAEGCPREHEYGSMALYAAPHGHGELVKWLCGEGGFAMDEGVMRQAARSGNLELVRWLRGKGCPWDFLTCFWAVDKGHVEVLRWARENGCPWKAHVRDKAAEKLGYTDHLGNLVDEGTWWRR